MNLRTISSKIPIFNRSFFYYYRIFHEYIGHRILLLGALSLIITLTEGLGIALFFTYLQDLTEAGKAPTSSLMQYLKQVLATVGIPATPNYIVLSVILIFAVRGCLIFWFNSYQYTIYMVLTKRMTSRLLDAFAAMNYREYLKRNTGHFTHLIAKEVSRCVVAYYQISAIIPKTVSILTYIFLSMRLNWRFTFISVIFGLGMTSIFKVVADRTKGHSKNLSRTEAIQTSLAIQLLTGFKYLFSTSSLRAVRARLEHTTKRAAHEGGTIGKLSAVIPAVSEPLIVAFIATSVYVQTNIIGGGLSELFIVIMFLYRVMKESTVVQASWQTFNQYVGGVDMVVEAIETLEKTREPEGEAAVAGIESAIELSNIYFRYGDRDVLNGISLSIPAKKMVAFVGESGSGKSTLVDIVTGLLRPTGGRVTLDHVPYDELKLSTLGALTGYVTQESVLFDETVANNVSLWEYESNPEVKSRIVEALDHAGCMDFVSRMPEGIHTPVGDRGVKLSGGQKQRLCIARELYKKPQLLILDEATSALDSETEKFVQESIEYLRGRATVVVIAHRLSTIVNCDLIYVLREGRVIESGSFFDLWNRADGTFRKMCELQGISLAAKEK